MMRIAGRIVVTIATIMVVSCCLALGIELIRDGGAWDAGLGVSIICVGGDLIDWIRGLWWPNRQRVA